MQELAYFYIEEHQLHAEPGHPERPERIEAIRQALQSAGWWERFPHLAPLALPEHILTSIHTPAYLDWLQSACALGEWLDADTYTLPVSWELALKAAGGTSAAALAVWRGEARRAYALPRPPGHHATPTRGMGFCLLNNIALAAEYLIRQEGLQRIAIVDLDLHHGNGTQEIFWERSDVLYISTHQVPLYPGTGMLDELGVGAGYRATANFPLPPASGDQAYRAIMAEMILPLLDQYHPQMILVSLGFDAHWLDPMGHMRLSATGYGDLVASLVAWADKNCEGKILLNQEGGYDLRASAVCGQIATAILLGETWEDPIGPPPRGEGKSWQFVLEQAKQIWAFDSLEKTQE